MTNINKLLQWVQENGAWNKSYNSIVCQKCKKKFQAPPSAKRKFCSRIYSDSSHPVGEKSSHWIRQHEINLLRLSEKEIKSGEFKERMVF